MSVRALPMAKALVARGHSVTMVLPPWDDPERTGQRWTEQGVEIINVSLPPRIPVLFHLWLTWKLVAPILWSKPDVVHLFKPKAYAGLTHLALWLLRLLTRFNVKLVVDTDDWEQAWNEVSPYPSYQKNFFAWQEEWGLKNADVITVASRALEAMVSQHGRKEARTQAYSPPHTKLFYVPNGSRFSVDPPSILNDYPVAVRHKWGLEGVPVILLYSRFLEFRLARIIKLVQTIATNMPEARWLVVGRGLNGEEVVLRIKLAEEGLTEYVKFAGWVPMEELPAYFQAVDVAIYPYDNTLINRTKCSVKLIDLLAAGLPVVADAVGQNCDYIQNEETGILVAPEDDKALGDALLRLLYNPELRHKIGRAAKWHIEKNFNWCLLAQIVEQAYYDS